MPGEREYFNVTLTKLSSARIGLVRICSRNERADTLAVEIIRRVRLNANRAPSRGLTGPNRGENAHPVTHVEHYDNIKIREPARIIIILNRKNPIFDTRFLSFCHTRARQWHNNKPVFIKTRIKRIIHRRREHALQPQR